LNAGYRREAAMTPNRAAFGAVFSACFLLLNTQVLLADDNPGVEAAQRGNQFTSQYGAIKSDLKNILDDGKKLGENIKTLKDPQKSLSELQNFRATLSDALDAISDDGAITKQSQSYLSYLVGELQRAQSRRPDLTDEETRTLITGWQSRLTAATEKVKIIDKLRTELVTALISLQGKEYYIEELIKLDEADKVMENLDAIVDDLGKTINDLKDIQEKISS
jgi:hypothetical protein